MEDERNIKEIDSLSYIKSIKGDMIEDHKVWQWILVRRIAKRNHVLVIWEVKEI